MQIVSRIPRIDRRPWMLLLAAATALSASLGWRFLTGQNGPSYTPPPAPVELTAEQWIIKLQDGLRRDPENTEAYAQLGLAFLQRVRENADAMLYAQAERAFEEALSRDPRNLDALVGQGVLAASRHDFSGALAWADQAWEINTFRSQILGIKVDALVELGRYSEAIEAAQQMVDLRPDLTSYSRVSYIRELHGQTDGAIAAMLAAVDSAVPGSEAALWTETQLGHLYFNRGELGRAEAAYERVLRFQPDYPYAQGGLARVLAARGETARAIETFQALVNRLPLPEFAIPLGELYELTGQSEPARLYYGLVRAMQQLNASAGVNVDLELALFDADHGSDPQAAVARARQAYARRPSIYAADALAWSLYKAGNCAEAAELSDLSLRLQTQDALLYFHNGMIADCLGQSAQARARLKQALEINPHFSILYADDAKQWLVELESGR